MPTVIDYPAVQQRLLAGGFTSLYHNSGAFGFLKDAKVIGWIGPDDPSIRPTALAFVRKIPEPHAANLARLLTDAWRDPLVGDAWLMPKSHWHYELQFGNRELLEPLLSSLGIDPATLHDRNSGDAIAFAPAECDLLRETAARLLAGLRGSDFLIAFPDAHTVCTIHHHQQVWWQTTSDAVAAALEAISPAA